MDDVMWNVSCRRRNVAQFESRKNRQHGGGSGRSCCLLFRQRWKLVHRHGTATSHTLAVPLYPIVRVRLRVRVCACVCV